MMENKLVSIVIATFNAEKYILDLLDSVKKQTYENLELIIADDCSADNTQNIISDWVTENRGRFFRVELLFAKENQGTCKNYNQAMKRSNGEYIKLVDGDDIIITVGEIFRKSFMERFHWFDEQYDLLEDYPFWLRITEEGVKIPFLDKKVAKYRISETSVRNPEKNTSIYNVRISKASKRNFYNLRLKGLLKERQISVICRNIRRYLIRDIVIFLGNSNSNKICRGLTILE